MRRRSTTGAWACAATVVMALVLAANADAISNRLAFTAQFGAEVNQTTKANVCTVESGNSCQDGQVPDEMPGGFDFPYSVAAAPAPEPGKQGDIYVSDHNNNRIQELTADGAFVSMFGWDVNKTKVAASASQAEDNVCTAASDDECQKGAEGASAGHITRPESITVDQLTGDVYVLSEANHRVEMYKPGGEFVLMIGQEVNETKDMTIGTTEAEKNLCTAKSGDVCKAGVVSASGSTEHAAFKTGSPRGDLLTLGGPEDRLYLGDEERVQEFNKETGEWVHEVSLSSLAPNGEVRAIAVAPDGTLYFAYAEEKKIHVLPPGGSMKEFGTHGTVSALALDSFGRIAVTVFGSPEGVLYSGGGASPLGTQLGEFEPTGGVQFVYGLAFNSEGALYAADAGRQDVQLYTLATVADLITGECQEAKPTGMTLTGEVNPKGLVGEQTQAWFQYTTNQSFETPAEGPGVLETSKQPVGMGSVLVPIKTKLEGLRPNQAYSVRVAAEDENAHAPPLTGELESCSTSGLPPAVGAGVQAFEVTFSSAVLSTTLNPENANTVYRFQYGACLKVEGCLGLRESQPLESLAYGVVGATQTVSSLAPSTTYSYRLIAINQYGQARTSTEGAFSTQAAPKPSAITEPVAGVTPTSAILNGAVNPDGAGATYAFQAGVYTGSGTVYTTVVQGPTGSQHEDTPESFTLTGLQPGVEYAYRIVVSSAYGSSEGAPELFTTASLLSVISPPPVPAMLAVPKISFPKSESKCKRGYVRKLSKCVKVKKKKKKKSKAKKKRKAKKSAERLGTRNKKK